MTLEMQAGFPGCHGYQLHRLYFHAGVCDPADFGKGENPVDLMLRMPGVCQLRVPVCHCACIDAGDPLSPGSFAMTSVYMS